VTWNEHGAPSFDVMTRVACSQGHGTGETSETWRTSGFINHGLLMKRTDNPIETDLNPAIDPRHLRVMMFLIFTAFVTGCGPVTTADVPFVKIGTNHDPATCGRVGGNVTWVGDVPDVPPLNVYSLTGTRSVPHAHAPAIHAVSKRLNGAVVFLKGIDPARAKPWDRSSIVVEANDSGIAVLDSGLVGFVRHGDPFQLANEGTVPHVVRGRGASNFAVPLPDLGNPTTRTAKNPGLIHLTSGSNVAPASAYLFVCEHPYYAVTKGDGAYAFDAVPNGEYDLVLWHPNWNVLGHDRNPETGLINRYRYGEPFEKVNRVTVTAGGLTTLSLTFP
jgi:hypothetical protein